MDPQIDTPTPPAAPAAAATPRRGGADGWRRAGAGPSLPEVHRSVAVPRTGRTWFGFARKLLAFSGPGYLIAVGYMDPGNWATDLAGGSQFGYALLSVVIISSLMAIVLQHLAVRLGVATGRDLAQACRDHFPPGISFALWVGAEVAIAACDLAEVIGSAIALNLLFHLPLIWGVGLTAADVLAVLFLQGRSFRLVELLVLALIGVIAVCFGVQIFWSRPEWAALAAGCLPSAQIVRDPAMLYVAVGILGATVMPHNLYLHSSLTQTRHYDLTPAGRREALVFGTLDATLALSFALLVNAAILVLAAATFHRRGHPEVAEIQDAFRLLSPLLGAGAASTLFAVALLASGQNSTLTGTLAGQVVMEGFLHLRLPPVARRLLTRLLAIVPALVVTAVAGEHGTARLLVLSQVILSLQLPFAVVPLVWFTGQRAKMGALVTPRWLQATGWGLAALIVVLNAWLLLAPGLRGTTSGP